MSCLFGGVELVPETGRELVAFSDLTIQGLYCIYIYIYIHTYIYIYIYPIFLSQVLRSLCLCEERIAETEI